MNKTKNTIEYIDRSQRSIIDRINELCKLPKINLLKQLSNEITTLFYDNDMLNRIITVDKILNKRYWYKNEDNIKIVMHIKANGLLSKYASFGRIGEDNGGKIIEFISKNDYDIVRNINNQNK